jgi:predicted amidohydrolase YtcJ
VRPGLLKGYLDGSLGSRTAWFFEPYADDPMTAGMCTFPPAELERLVVAADAAGFQVGLHAIGDRAVALALDVYAAARAANGPRDARHRIEHAQNVRDADLRRMAQLEVVASMQPSHRTGDEAFFRARLGPARERGAYAWRRLLDAGVLVAFGSDFPVESMDPRTSLAAAVAGGVTIAEALDAFTRRASQASGLDGELPADLVVWGGDLFGATPSDILGTPIDFTIFDGEVVHERA